MMPVNLLIKTIQCAKELPYHLSEIVKQNNHRIELNMKKKTFDRKNALSPYMFSHLVSKVSEFKEQYRDDTLEEFKDRMVNQRKFSIINSSYFPEKEIQREDYLKNINQLRKLTHSEHFDEYSKREYEDFMDALSGENSNEIYEFIKNNPLFFGLYEYDPSKTFLTSLILKTSGSSHQNGFIKFGSFYSRIIAQPTLRDKFVCYFKE